MKNNTTHPLYLLVLMMIFSISILTAQSEQAPVGPAGPVPSSNLTAQAQWDLLFDFDATTDSGQGALAGVVHVDSFFWAANWNEDRRLRFYPCDDLGWDKYLGCQ